MKIYKIDIESLDSVNWEEHSDDFWNVFSSLENIYDWHFSRDEVLTMLRTLVPIDWLMEAEGWESLDELLELNYVSSYDELIEKWFIKIEDVV